jgi:hypothetical protein
MLQSQHERSQDSVFKFIIYLRTNPTVIDLLTV